MATRKRISDVLREETKQVSATEDSPVIDTTAEVVSEQEAQVGKDVTSETSDRNSGQQASSNKTELEATIAELKAALEQANQRENNLQQRIDDLQSELYEQKNLVQKLKKSKDQADLKSELEQAKKDSLRLAESNSKLIQELDELKKEVENTKTESSKKTGLQFAYFSKQKTDDPSDFASKSWLLD